MSQLSAVLFAIAAIALGRAIQIQNGFYDAAGLRWLTVAIVAMSAAVGLRHRGPNSHAASRWPLTELVLGAGLVWQFLTLLTARPAMYIDFNRPLQRPVFAAGLLAAFALSAGVFAGSRQVRRASFVAALAVFAGLGAWMLRASPDPAIDVVTVHREAIAALTSGRSPFAISFKNIYGATTFYGEGATEGDRVLFGLPYPPISLLMALPGAWLTGDYRARLLASLVVSGALIGFCAGPRSRDRGGERQAMLAALLALFTPRVFFVLEQGWTEPFVLVLLAATVFLISRREQAGAAAAGLLFGVKQYMALGLPLCWMLLPRGRRLRTAGIATAVAAALTLPFVAADPRGILHSVVMVQFAEPFRLDSLGFLSWMGRHGLEEPHLWITLLAAAVAAGFAVWRLPAGPGAFAAGLALVLVLTFAFGKKAFCNYYFLVIGATCLALAAGFEDVPDSPERDEPRVITG